VYRGSKYCALLAEVNLKQMLSKFVYWCLHDCIVLAYIYCKYLTTLAIIKFVNCTDLLLLLFIFISIRSVIWGQAEQTRISRKGG
jgi:hypothetical protein